MCESKGVTKPGGEMKVSTIMAGRSLACPGLLRRRVAANAQASSCCPRWPGAGAGARLLGG